MDLPTLDKKIINYLGALTVIILLSYIGIITYSYLLKLITYENYITVVGPISGTLLGYWIRGK